MKLIDTHAHYCDSWYTAPETPEEPYAAILDRLLGEDISESEILDPEVNIRCGVRYLAWLSESFESERARSTLIIASFIISAAAP